MNINPVHINLNGQVLSVESLHKKKVFENDWEQEFYTFLEEWYSDQDFISVQTSGSTGKAKQIHLKKDFVAQSALRTIKYFKLKEGQKVLHCLPCRFIAGKLMLVRALIGNLQIHLVNPGTDFAFLEKNSFKFAAMVPFQVSKLLKFKCWNIDELLIGGDAISSMLEEQLQKVSTLAYSSYGMTETATHIALRKLNGMNASSYYRCLENIKVGNSDNNCLQILLPGTKEQIFQTTDIAEIIDDRTFRILGRSDNVIIAGGIKYSPEAIEKKLDHHLAHPFIISSQPHPKLGKQIVLKIEANFSENLNSKVQEICNKELNTFERPRQILFVKKLARTQTGKIIRN